MKKALFLAIFSTQLLTDGQENWGKINFKTASIPKSDGNGTYNVPIYDYSGAGIPGATVGLFVPGSSAPFVTGTTGTTPSSSPYVVTPAPSRIVAVPGYGPGERAVIIIRIYSGQWSVPSFSMGEWIFTTLPLGGVPPGGGDEIPTPSLTGWGLEDSSGITVAGFPANTTIGISPTGPILAAPAYVQINVGIGRDPGYTATNLSVYAGPILVASVVPAAVGPRYFTTPPLGAGTYSLYSVITGVWDPDHFAGSTQSIPINITVVDPIDITLTPPTIANGQLTFQYTVNPGLSYAIQTSTNFTDWQTADTAKPANSPALFTQPLTNATPTFHRVQRLP